MSYVLFYKLSVFGESFIWVFVIGFTVFGAMVNGSYVALLAKSFPAPLRYSGVGLSYSLGIALFGGIAPLAFTGLIKWFGLVEAPAFYMIACGAITLASVRLMRRRVSN